MSTPRDRKLAALQELICYGNQLTSLPSEIGQLTALQVIHCGSNKLTSLPAEIGNLTALMELECSGNQLTSLPAEIGNLTALMELSCGANVLTSLPAGIGNLTALQLLNCSENQLTSLPMEIGNLRKLQVLRCTDNNRGAVRLELPPQLFSLPQKCKLFFSGSKVFGGWIVEEEERDNGQEKVRVRQLQEDDARATGATEYVPITPAECGGFLGTTIESLREYVRQLVGVKLVRPKNVRLMIVGDANAGKTTLVESFCGRTLAQSLQRRGRDAAGKRTVTFGLDVKEWRAPNDVVHFSVWDFAGQPEYHPTHQLFLASDALYVLAFDASAAAVCAAGIPSNPSSGQLAACGKQAKALSGVDAIIAYLETWTAMIGARAPGVRVMIVGTHADILKTEAGQTVLKLLSAKIRDFVSRLQSVGRYVVVDQPCLFVDALHVDSACRELADLCVSAASKIIDQRESIPDPFQNLGKELRKMGKKTPVLSLEQFNQYAFEKFYVRLPRLALTLREWGWVEYFADHPTLKDVVFVNPQWLAKMMACVATKLGSSLGGRGTVSVATLHSVWRTIGHVSDEKLLSHLVSVMLAFNLAHKLNWQTLVIPSLLQSADDSDVVVARRSHKAELMLNQQHQSDDLEVLRPVYTLSLFPSGLFSRLFVRVYTVPGIDDVLGWQGGFLAMLPSSFDVVARRAAEPVALRVEVVSTNHSLEVAGSSASAVAVFEEALLSLCGEFFDGRISVYRNGGEIRFDDSIEVHHKGREADEQASENISARQANPAAETWSADHWLRGRCVVVVSPPLITFDASLDIELGMQLGKGSYGEVYRCEGTGKKAALPLGATFALKRLVRVPGGGAGAEIIDESRSFNTEFSIMRKLAACRFTLGALGAQFGGKSGTLVTHVLMPVFEMTLHEHVRQRANSGQLKELGWFYSDDVADWLMQISQGLLHMHKRGLAHLDVKPENVLVRLRGPGAIKLLAIADFGNTMDAGSVRTPAGILTRRLGTPGFIAPELFAATCENPCINLFATDIFSLGVLASFAVSAILPTGNSQEQRGIPSHGSAVCPPVDADNPENWDAIRGFVAACVAVDPVHRPKASRVVSSRLNVGGRVCVDLQACEQRRSFLLSGAPHQNIRSALIAEESSREDVAQTCAELEEQLTEAKRRAESERQRAEAETQRADIAEKQLAEAKRVGAEAEIRNAEAEKQRADIVEKMRHSEKHDVEPSLLHFLCAFKLEHLLDQCHLLRACRLQLLLRRTKSDLKRILGDEVFNTPDGQHLVGLVQSFCKDGVGSL